MANPFHSLSGKLLLATGAAIALIVLGYTVHTGWRTSVRANAQVIELATSKAHDAASQVGQQIAEATSAGTALAAVLEGYLAGQEATTDGVIALLEALPPRYETLFSAWVSGLPGGPTDQFVKGTTGRNAAGVFTPYWTKTESGNLTFQTFDIDTTQMWFDGPVKTGESFVTEPYTSVEGYLLTSISVPVRVGGQTVALAGVDITLDRMTGMLGAMQPFAGGRVMLLDNGGKWVANPDAALLTKAYEGQGVDAVQEALKTGALQVVEGMPGGAKRVIYPFSAVGMNATWAVVLDVPAEVFTLPVRREVMIAVAGSMVILVLVLGTIYLSSTAFVRRPLSGMLATVNGLAAGRYDATVPGLGRRDEIGAMAESVEQLRLRLIERQALEAEQQRLRAEADAARELHAREEARRQEERETRRREDQEREARAMAEAEAARQRDEAQRNARAAEQAQVVDSLAAGLRGLAVGNLDVTIDARFPEGYEQLRADFNETVDKLADLLRAIGSATQSIVGGVDEITGATTGLSRQTETSAASLEETAAALNELTASVQSAAQSARHADTVVRSATDQVRVTAQVVGETVSAMRAIQGSSDKISRIINVIDDIAFQTNLLALNAGVEAARAGEAGRGFAVVASEVRALAQRASDAAREINALISDSGAQVNSGVALVGRAGEALDAIVQAIDVISNHVAEIASSANEQASGIAEINTVVTQLDRAQQHNAAGFEETAAACLALNEQAKALEGMVSRFNVSVGWTEPDVHHVAAMRAASRSA